MTPFIKSTSMNWVTFFKKSYVLDAIMKWKEKIIEARFLKRYKRFFADIEVQGTKEVAHVPNTGSMKSCLIENIPCLVTKSDNPERKLKWTLQALKPQDVWVGVNTQIPSMLVEEVFTQRLVSDWKSFDVLQKEVKTSEGTRLDFCFSKGSHQHFVEVKNVTYKDGEWALFPDAVTERGQKHLQELISLLDKNITCEILYVVQRADATQFKPADEIDPVYGELLRKASQAGVKLRALQFEIQPSGIEFKQELPVILV